MAKKVIKHATIRRRVMGTVKSTHNSKLKAGDKSHRTWTQAFNVGFVEQAFSRVCVRESLQHGEENAPFRVPSAQGRTAHGHGCRLTHGRSLSSRKRTRLRP